jgi:hypothetical protein
MIVGRQQAILAGSKTYVGRQCRDGHFLRYTRDQSCVQCKSDRASTEASKAASAARSRDYRTRGRRAIAVLAELGRV